jgi:citrate synthase
VAAGLLAVGDEHGGAGSVCMEMIAAGLARARAEGLSREEVASRVVAEMRTAGRRVPGLGHRTHTVDPRSIALFDLARQRTVAGAGVAFLEAVAAALRAQGNALPINVDGALAAVLHDLGFPPPFGKLVFFVGRMAGLTAEVAEEYLREKPMRVHIPVTYDGPPARDLD